MYTYIGRIQCPGTFVSAGPLRNTVRRDCGATSSTASKIYWVSVGMLIVSPSTPLNPVRLSPKTSILCTTTSIHLKPGNNVCKFALYTEQLCDSRCTRLHNCKCSRENCFKPYASLLSLYTGKGISLTTFQWFRTWSTFINV